MELSDSVWGRIASVFVDTLAKTGVAGTIALLFATAAATVIILERKQLVRILDKFVSARAEESEEIAKALRALREDSRSSSSSGSWRRVDLPIVEDTDKPKANRRGTKD